MQYNRECSLCLWLCCCEQKLTWLQGLGWDIGLGTIDRLLSDSDHIPILYKGGEGYSRVPIKCLLRYSLLVFATNMSLLSTQRLKLARNTSISRFNNPRNYEHTWYIFWNLVATRLATRIDEQICFVGPQFPLWRHLQADEEPAEPPSIVIHPRVDLGPPYDDNGLSVIGDTSLSSIGNSVTGKDSKRITDFALVIWKPYTSSIISQNAEEQEEISSMSDDEEEEEEEMRDAQVSDEGEDIGTDGGDEDGEEEKEGEGEGQDMFLSRAPLDILARKTLEFIPVLIEIKRHISRKHLHKWTTKMENHMLEAQSDVFMQVGSFALSYGVIINTLSHTRLPISFPAADGKSRMQFL